MTNLRKSPSPIRRRLAAALVAAACCAVTGMAVAEHHGEHGHGAEQLQSTAAEGVGFETERIETELTQAGISVSDARIRLPLPGQTTAVIYLTLNNRAADVLTLAAVEVQGSERAELHQHVHEDGMMRMRKVNRIVVAAGKSLELAPGGYHIMAFEMVPPTGDATLQRAYPVTLIFESGERTTVNAWPVH